MQFFTMLGVIVAPQSLLPGLPLGVECQPLGCLMGPSSVSVFPLAESLSSRYPALCLGRGHGFLGSCFCCFNTITGMKFNAIEFTFSGVQLRDFWYAQSCATSHHCCLFLHVFITLKRNSVPIGSHSSPFSSPCNDWSTFCLYGFAFSGHLCQWNYT